VSQPQPVRRPRGRSERIRQQVHRAVIDLLREWAVDDLTLAVIAERSGVHQATIYRRWGSVPLVLQDVVAAGPARTSPLPDTGTLRGDLDAYAVAVASSLSGPLGVLMLRVAVSNIPPQPDRSPSVVLVERAAQLQQLLDRARDRGESPPTVAELLDLVVAPLYFHALFDRPASTPDAKRFVDRLLAMSTSAATVARTVAGGPAGHRRPRAGTRAGAAGRKAR